MLINRRYLYQSSVNLYKQNKTIHPYLNYIPNLQSIHKLKSNYSCSSIDLRINNDNNEHNNTISNNKIITYNNAINHKESFIQMVGDSNVLINPIDMIKYCTDWTSNYKGSDRHIVVFPKNTIEVSKLLAYCNVNKIIYIYKHKLIYKVIVCYVMYLI